MKCVSRNLLVTSHLCFQGNLSDLGRLMMQGSFSMWTEHKKGHAKVKDLARFKPMQRHLFLHQKALLFCKKRDENGEGYEKAPSYSFKHSLNVRILHFFIFIDCKCPLHRSHCMVQDTCLIFVVKLEFADDVIIAWPVMAHFDVHLQICTLNTFVNLLFFLNIFMSFRVHFIHIWNWLWFLYFYKVFC